MCRLPLLAVCLFAAPALAADPTVADVKHTPTTPKPDEIVLVSARITGANKVALKLQAVAPGKYIKKSDAEYEKEWTDLPMHDDGKDGDEKAGDGVFSARVPKEQQKHRWLMRYRVVATGDKSVVAPPATDPSPNFAYWCDGGPAAWTGSREPGKAKAVTFSADFLGTLQSLTLVAKAADVAKSQWDPNFHKQRQEGTAVYRGVVYDHIKYSNRGQGSAHIAGKNKWAVKLNGSQKMPFVDHDGVAFPAPIDGLDLNPGCSTPYLPVHRGIAGLDEVMSMRAYRLAGVPSPPVTWVQWRVITDAAEVSAKDQFAGDLWGLYVAVGDFDPDLLADAKLADGLAWSVQSGVKHTPKGMTDADKVWEKFITTVRSNPKEEWWRANLDVTAYSSFHAMNRLLGNVDLRPDGNHGYYRAPTGKWSPIPWDNDMMFVPRTHQPGYIEAINCLNHKPIAVEFRNRAREVLDLFAADNTDKGGQVGQLVADLGAALTPKGHDVDWPRLDEARWNFSPRMNQPGLFYQNPAQADYWGGGFKRKLDTPDFAGFKKYLVDFCTDSRPKKTYAPNDGDQRGYGWGYLMTEAKDDKIPGPPAVTRPKADAFRFEATEFVSKAGHKAAAVEWRVGRVGKRGWYELTDHWKAEVKDNTGADIPAVVFKEAGEYRVRARWRDDSGRCSHWSEPVAVTTR